MSDVSLSASARQRLALLARAWEITPGEAVERLLDEFQREESPAPAAGATARVAIHALYDNTRVDGLFDLISHRVEVTTGPLAGRIYRSPSGAAIAVVSLYNRRVSPNRNGWSFWTVTETGERLQSLRGSR